MSTSMANMSQPSFKLHIITINYSKNAFIKPEDLLKLITEGVNSFLSPYTFFGIPRSPVNVIQQPKDIVIQQHIHVPINWLTESSQLITDISTCIMNRYSRNFHYVDEWK